MWVARTPLSLTIRFKRANRALCQKYSLANETLFVDGKRRDYSHIYVMQHYTRELVDAFIRDLDQPGAFAAPITARMAPAAATEVCLLESGRPLIYVPDYGRGMR